MMMILHVIMAFLLGTHDGMALCADRGQAVTKWIQATKTATITAPLNGVLFFGFVVVCFCTYCFVYCWRVFCWSPLIIITYLLTNVLYFVRHIRILPVMCDTCSTWNCANCAYLWVLSTKSEEKKILRMGVFVACFVFISFASPTTVRI